MYYYNLDNIHLTKLSDKNFIKYKTDIYIFQPIYNEKEVMEAYYITKDYPQFYSIIVNKDNGIFTRYQNQNYVLLKKNITPISMEQELFHKMYVIKGKYLLDRTDWYFLWTQKIDYFEYQLNHIQGKYPIIDESIDYFIGMAETAISYINYNVRKEQLHGKEPVICHKRINKADFFNPLNIVIDYKERDISEYLKYIFYTETYKQTDLFHIIKLANCDSIGYYLLYGRLFFPSYYFDVYERIINNRGSEEELKPIILRINEYEQYVKNIYQIINHFQEIKKIEWIDR